MLRASQKVYRGYFFLLGSKHDISQDFHKIPMDRQFFYTPQFFVAGRMRSQLSATDEFKFAQRN